MIPSTFDSRPPAFFWGVATSAYQSEGGYNDAGEPQTNWADGERREDVARCGRAAEFWTRYEEDFARCREMGLNAFRLGIEWSRVQPTIEPKASAPPAFDFAALDHYATMLAACRVHGLEPIVTLHHFIHPAWLGPDPWQNQTVPGLFEQYVTTAVTYLNTRLVERHGTEPLRFLITINEPNMLVVNTYLAPIFPARAPLGFRSIARGYNSLLVAHIRAYNAIHDVYAEHGWPAPQVTINNYCSDLYWSDKLLLDLLSLAERGVAREHVREHLHGKIDEFENAFRAANLPLRRDVPFYVGAALKNISRRLGYRRFDPEKFAPLLDAVYASPRKRLFDCIGLDYYDPFAAHLFRFPVWWDHEFKTKSVRSWMMNSVTSKWWDWRVLPRGLHFFCDYYSRDLGGRAVLIAENGMALRRKWNNEHSARRDKMTRSEFLRLHVEEVTRIVADGVPLIGYLHWSLFDNYEWGSFTPRFGLFSLDFTQGTERIAKDHLGDCASATYRDLIAVARKEMNALPQPVPAS